MEFINAAGEAVKLTIVGYQYPHARPGDEHRYDANWLMVRLDGVMQGRAWTYVDPCLMTWDVARLADWLDSLFVDQPMMRLRCTFDEPMIFFELIEDASSRKLRVYFEAFVRPPWRANRSVGMEDCWLDFPLAEIDLPAAVTSLRAQLAQYPVRTAEG